jgi:hypothetical protein
MMNGNMSTLAQTLARSGLAMSANEAMRMAQSIADTESIVTKGFNQGVDRIESTYETKKRTYQEEMDYLIQKTSFDKKEFHNPIAGYSRERVQKPDPTVFYELEQQTRPDTVAVKVETPRENYALQDDSNDTKPAEIAATDAVLQDNRPLSQVLSTPEPEPRDDFIMKVEEQPARPVQEEPFVREVKEKPQVRIPIEKVDLMQHFKFG